jgi:hypothetical protein
VTDDHKIQLFAAAIQGVIAAHPNWVEESPPTIVEKAVSIARIAIFEANAGALLTPPQRSVE